MTNRFEGVDLGTSDSMARMAKSIARRRVEIIVELVDFLHARGHIEAAKLLQDKAVDELKEVGL